ncbi:MAG: hypothetical protein QXE12_00650 [Conexivisphaerales archaeon]
MARKRVQERKKGQGSNIKLFAITFVAVFGILTGITLFLVYPTGPSIYHFPENMTVFQTWISSQDWMQLVPYNAMTASAINISGATSVGITSLNNFFLNIYQIRMGLTDSNLTFIAGYELPPSSPLANSTEINFLKPTPFSYNLIYQKLNSTPTVVKEYYRGFTIFDIFNNDTVTRTLTAGRLFFYNGYIVYTQGSKNPSADIQLAINAIVGKYESLFANETVQKAIYAAMGGRTSFLALYYLNFPTQVSGSEIASKAVLLTSKGFMAIYAVGFDSQSSSLQNFNTFKRTYEYGSSYYIMDNFDVANIPYTAQEVGPQLQGF